MTDFYEAADKFDKFLKRNRVVLSPAGWWTWLIRNQEAWAAIEWWVSKVRERYARIRIMLVRGYDPECGVCGEWEPKLLVYSPNQKRLAGISDFLYNLWDVKHEEDLEYIYCDVEYRKEPWTGRDGIVIA